MCVVLLGGRDRVPGEPTADTGKQRFVSVKTRRRNHAPDEEMRTMESRSTRPAILIRRAATMLGEGRALRSQREAGATRQSDRAILGAGLGRIGNAEPGPEQAA